MTFQIKPMGFKHTGLFPEQAVNWDWMMDKITKANRPIRVLNLFAYTGGATVACLAAGASVCHVDSSKGMVTWAKENVAASGLADKPVRYNFQKRNCNSRRNRTSYDRFFVSSSLWNFWKMGEINAEIKCNL